MKAYTLFLTWFWTVINLRAMYASVRSLNDARDDLSLAKKANGLRKRLGQQHVRRESLRLLAYSLALLLGIASLTPLPAMFPQFFAIATPTLLVTIIAILWVNTELDWGFRKEMSGK